MDGLLRIGIVALKSSESNPNPDPELIVTLYGVTRSAPLSLRAGVQPSLASEGHGLCRLYPDRNSSLSTSHGRNEPAWESEVGGVQENVLLFLPDNSSLGFLLETPKGCLGAPH